MSKKATMPQPIFNPEIQARVKQLQSDYKDFNEQKELEKRVACELYPEGEAGQIHPELLTVFVKCRQYSTPKRMGGIIPQIQGQTLTTFDGLTYGQIGQIFNFIETLSVKEANDVGVSTDTYVEVLDHTYHKCALGVWSGRINEIKEEIVKMKEAIVVEMNKEIEAQNKYIAEHKPKSRAERKEANQMTVTSTKNK